MLFKLSSWVYLLILQVVSLVCCLVKNFKNGNVCAVRTYEPLCCAHHQWALEVGVATTNTPQAFQFPLPTHETAPKINY